MAGSNTAKGWGKKGSKLWMQRVIHEPALQKKLNRMLGDDDLRWLSPLAGEQETFDEYMLNQAHLPHELAFDRPADFYDFWPKRQPQWDGIAVSGDGRTLYLVEAKAHIRELNSSLASPSEASRALIRRSLDYVHDRYYPQGKRELWEQGFYQLGNRLVFLKMLTERVPFGNFEQVKLVPIHFVNDTTHIPTTLPEWKEHYCHVWKDMIGEPHAPDDVIMIYFDVKEP